VQTYDQNSENPDDILVENFATNDVLPGTYHLYARYASSDQSNPCGGTLYKDLGNYTFTAGQTTYVGLYPVYMPDVKLNINGETSTIVIRNNSNTDTAQVTTTFFLPSGWIGDGMQRSDSIPPRGTITFNPPTGYTYGSAMVVASQAVAVVVENIYDDGTRYLAAAYPGESQPATTVSVPYVVRNWLTLTSWRQTTDLLIQNTGSQQATVTITFYDSWDTYSGSYSVTRSISPKGQAIVYGTEMPVWESGWNSSLASARLTSDQPLAVVSTTRTGVSDSSGNIVTPYLAGSYRAFMAGSSKVYLPVAAREYYGYDSGLQVQNLSSGSTTFQIKYYQAGTSQPILTIPWTFSGYVAKNFWRPTGLPANYLGGAVVEVTAGGPVAAMGQYDRFSSSVSRYGISQYEALIAATQSSAMPHVWRSSPWNYTGIQAQNMGSSTANLTVNFYEASGGSAGSATKTNIPADGWVNFWSEIPAINGSAVGANSPFALQVNFDRLDVPFGAKDGMMGYSAVK